MAASGSSPLKNQPKDAIIIQNLLREFGVDEYDPRVVTHLLEFVYKYATDVLEDARFYSHHAHKKTVDAEDVKLAVKLHTSHSFVSPPSVELLTELAKTRNSVPLEPVKPHCGPRLPPDRYCQFASNYRMVKDVPKVPHQKKGSKNFSAGVIGEGGKKGEDGETKPKKGTKRARPDSTPTSEQNAAASPAVSYNFSAPVQLMKMEDENYD